MTGATLKTETWLWLAQRVSAVVLAGCIVVHLITMIIAMQGGLSTAEIAGRIGGNSGWLVFYGLFIVAVSVHAPIGLRAVLMEATGLGAKRIGLLTSLFGLFILVLGFRTITGLYQLMGAS